MAASDLDRYVDFAAATRQKLFSSPDELVSQASKYRTTLYRDMVKGLTQDKMLQGGTEIIDYVQLSYTSSYGHFNPTQTFTYTASDSLTAIKVPWRFAKAYSVVSEWEIDFQTGGEEVVFKRVKRAKDAELQLSFFEGQEDDLWATPKLATMESATALGDNVGDPYSLRCFITDDGGAPSSTNGGVTGSNWTTVMGVSPTTYPNWKNAYATFDNTSTTTRKADDIGVVSAMDDCWLSINWEAPQDMSAYMTDTKTNKLKIVCNKPSYKMLVQLATAKNNVLTPRNDLGHIMGIGPVYHGIPIKYVAKLDDVDFDDGGSHVNGVANAADGSGKLGYRWRFINFNHIRPIYHSKHFRRLTKWDGGAGNPFTRVMLEDTAFNYWCQNRREQGIVRAA